MRNHGPLPLQAVRDLLGIVRAMFRAAREEGAGPARLQRIAEAGRRLNVAIELASETEPNTVGHRAAWLHAEAAIRLIGDEVSVTSTLEPIVAAAGRRIYHGRT